MGAERRFLSKKPEFYAEREKVLRQAGSRLADHLSLHPLLMLDLDGVLFRGNGFSHPTLTALGIIPPLQALEKKDVSIGIATGRVDSVVGYLRHSDLELSGPKILESGHRVEVGDETQDLGHPGLRRYMGAVDTEIRSLPYFVDSWDEVRARAQNGVFAVCPGNGQWRQDGGLITTIWFHYNGDRATDEAIAASFVPMLEGVAEQTGLEFPTHIAVSTTFLSSHPSYGSPAVIGVRGRKDGEPINKATAASLLKGGGWIFIADGPGDLPMARVTKNRGGLNVGVGGGIDITPEIDQFMGNADVTVRHPAELARLLRYTADAL